MWRTIATLSGAALLALTGVGCGAAAPPVQARTETIAAIQSAREVGAAATPRAAYHLELAEEQLARAEVLVEQGRMDRAARMLRRAEADAELAIAMTREVAVEAEAQEIRTRIRQMRERHL